MTAGSWVGCIVIFSSVIGFVGISFSLGKFHSARLGRQVVPLRSLLARQRQFRGSWHLVVLPAGFRGIRRESVWGSICGTDTPAAALPAAGGFSHPFSITRGPATGRHGELSEIPRRSVPFSGHARPARYPELRKPVCVRSNANRKDGTTRRGASTRSRKKSYLETRSDPRSAADWHERCLQKS